MTAPDPTLAARLLRANASAGNNQLAMGAYRKLLQSAYENYQLITIAEADARVEAAVLAERERAKRADCDAFSNPLKDCC